MRSYWIALAFVLGGCSASGNWTQAGADATATARDYAECRALAGTAVNTEANIDQDILATRHDDRQRTSIVRIEAQNIRDETRDRAAAITASCMQAKGFAKPR
jgi:hypothetical protein